MKNGGYTKKMKLEHNFSNETRHIFLYRQTCYLCKGNGNNKGGLEIHHICGRKKHERYLDSPFNASVLCGECHLHISHDQEVQYALFKYTARLLLEEWYKPVKDDILFINEHSKDKFNKEPKEVFDFLLSL